ncbi:MAG: tetratricopeptide repeat protein [Bdellovibrionales bacterium]|nr:tetratricopeptide repeat protein [Bdellovibrionales bacterium]
MRLNQSIGFVGLIACLSGCSSFPLSSPGVYKSSAYDVKGDAPQSMALLPEEKLNEIQSQSKADYHFTLAETYSMQGEWAKAIENYKMSLVYDPNSYRSHFRLAGEYVRAGLVNQAVEHCEFSLKSNPKFSEAQVLLSSLHSVLGFHEKARQGYRQLLQIDPANQEASLLLGATYVDEGKMDQAIKYFESLVKNSQSPYLVWYYIGRTYLQKKPASMDSAEVAFKTSVRLQPQFVQSVLELGSIYEKRGQNEKARNLYEGFQKNYGPDVTVAESLVQIYLGDSNYAKAFEQLKIINDLDQGNLNAQLKMAFILVDQKKYKEAIPLLEAILHQTPDSDRVRFYLGAVYEEVKDYSAALQAFKGIPRTSKYYPDAIMHAAYLYKLTNDVESALALLEKSLPILDDNPKIYALYGSLLDTQKKYEEAKKVLEAGGEKFPKDTQLLYQLGAVYDQLNQVEKTVMAMEKLLAIDSNHIEGLNYLAYVYAEKTQNLETAEKLARRALALKPNDGFILDTLGWVLFKQNKIAEAIRTLERAHQYEDGESVIAEHLGDAYFKNELPNKAKDMYIKAVQNEKNEANARKIRDKIDTIEVRIQSEQKIRNRVPASAPSSGK